jgi:hypothetical protein
MYDIICTIALKIRQFDLEKQARESSSPIAPAPKHHTDTLVTSLLPLVTSPETPRFKPVISDKNPNHLIFQTKPFAISIAPRGVQPPPKPLFPTESIGTRPAPEPPPGYSCATRSMLKVSLSSPIPTCYNFSRWPLVFPTWFSI